MSVDPGFEGIKIGSLVEVTGLAASEFGTDINGEFGQVASYVGGETKKFQVFLACGLQGEFDLKNLKPASSLRRPGEGGTETSFDMLVGPKTDDKALGEEMSACLIEKGVCVLKVCQNAKVLDSTFNTLQDIDEEGRLARLPEEIEEGYLGTSCRGKCIWFDPSEKDLYGDANLRKMDENLSYIAQMLQPYSDDTLGEFIDERTPGLLCMTLTDESEAEFPYPESDDAILGSFLTTWRRSLLRAVHFSGPGTASVLFEKKGTEKAEKLPKAPAELNLKMSATTILLFRPDIFEYTCEVPEESIMMITNYLSAAPGLKFGPLEGDTAWVTEGFDGPPKPAGKDHIHVLNNTCRMPACWDNQWAYYSGLQSATDAVIEVPRMRWDVDLYWTPDENAFETWQTTTKHQSFCEGAELFDNKHFEISNAEASGMDPVQRLICEAGSQSLALMGLTKKMANRKATHAGFAVGNDKLDWMSCDKVVAPGAAMGGTSTVLAIIANRFSFLFNLKGANFVCDTACSASLCSTHCVKMMLKERTYDPLEWFLSMGAHLCLSGAPFIGCSQSHMSSPQGRSFTFNASANGYLRGEGISGFMMKWGSYNDESIAILRATQVGQDGRSASLTAPNGPAQEEMIVRAIKEAQMTAPESTVWECHGTGTSLGDPIEVGAVRKVQVRMPRSEPLMITSIKTNIGHLEGGAAMGGMVKCILQCERARCLSTIHLRTLNPHLEHTKFDAIFQTEGACYAYIQGHSQVSSFGFGGTNGHGVFWGINHAEVPDPETAFKQKLAKRPHPEVRPFGKNYDDWEADFPDTRAYRKGATFSVTIKDKEESESVKWVLKNDGPDFDAEDEDTFFAITGNFNSWEDDRMAAGDAPGVHTVTVEIPDAGIIEWRFLMNGEKAQVLAPATNKCDRKTETIIGPAQSLTNVWSVVAPAGTEIKIELFCKSGMKAVMWLAEKAGGE
jgi:polyketide synthase-associated protein